MGNVSQRKRGAACGGRRNRTYSPAPLRPRPKTKVLTEFPLTSLETASVSKKELKKLTTKGGRGSGEFHAYPDIGKGQHKDKSYSQ